jgi:AraC-like DNA-binding protein
MPPETPPRDLWILDAREQADAAERYRQACAQLFDVTLLDADEAFFNRMEGYNLGGVVLARCAGVPQRFDRRYTHIIADPADSVMAVLELRSGGWSGIYDGRPADGGMGSIRLVDMSRPFDMTTAAFETLNLVIPRAALDEQVGQRDFHGRVVSEDTASGRMLGAHMRAVWDSTGTIDTTEAALAAKAAAILFSAAILAHGDAAVAEARPVEKMLLASARDFVIARLADPELSPETVRQHLGVSRSLLYKVFEPAGGVSAFIQSRRLDQAFDEIIRDQSERKTLAEIGYGLGFRSNAHFSRVFRARFGVTPGRLRRLGASARQEGLSALERPDDAFVWLSSLL